MVIIERPCCDVPLAVDLPLPDLLHCDNCAIAWAVADPDPEPKLVALAA